MKKLTIILALAIFAGCSKPAGHTCPFKLCPYKGQTKFAGVIYTGETAIDYEAEGTDSWCIDKLHFEYPAASYDELEAKLFAP